MAAPTVSSSLARVSASSGEAARRRAASIRIPTAVITWIESSWMSAAIRARSSSWARTRRERSSRTSSRLRRSSSSRSRSAVTSNITPWRRSGPASPPGMNSP